MKKFVIRSARKSAHLSSKALRKSLRLAEKIEDKATRILTGKDFSVRIEESTPFEKIYYNSIEYITPLSPALPAPGDKSSVTLLLPTLDGKSFFGGTATALVVAAKLALQTNKSLKIVQTLKTGQAKDLQMFFQSEGVEISEQKIHVTSVADRTYNTYGYLSIHPEDIFMASAWWDAYLLSRLPLPKKFIYLIQDFEPIFYNNSDLYILAESTYKTDKFIPLCNTKLIHGFMKDRNYPAMEDALWFEPAVSRIGNGVAIKKKIGEKKRLFLYGRPNVHRNLFFTALNSIDYCFKAGFLQPDEWELFMGGQDSLADIQLSTGPKIKNLGKLPMQEYIDFSKTVDLAVSLMMAPHPNYPTLEFASIGSSVVTTKYANKQDLSNYSKNITTSDINEESIAGAIHLASKQSYEEREKNLATTKIETSWGAVLDKSLERLTSKL